MLRPLGCGSSSTLLPLLFSATTAVGIAGCGSSVPKSQSPVVASVVPGQFGSRTNSCANLKAYGELYVDTCSFYAKQCSTQNSDERCSEASSYFAMRHHPIPWHRIPNRLRRNPALHLKLQKEARLAALDPKNFLREWRTTAELLLRQRGFLKRGENIDKVIRGHIAGARISKSGRKELVIMFLDHHTIEEVQEIVITKPGSTHTIHIHTQSLSDIQKQIIQTAKALNSRGLSLIGAEAYNVSEEVPCSDETHSTEQLACEIGARTFIVGLEDPDTYERHAKLAMSFEENPNSDADTSCELLQLKIDFEDLAARRSDILFTNLQKAMADNKQSAAGLIVGLAHLSDFKAMCEADDLNCIAIAVPAVIRWLSDYIEDQHKEIAEYASATASRCQR